ncbi:MAG TPA: hypothetical protein VJL29_04250 [Thermoguttaceae bacterium]|nr:hypothetical protein [Thermoguttaceae bacterium]
MAELMQRMGPMTVVAAIFVWCCWPYLTGSATSAGSSGIANIAALPKSLLSPVIKASTAHDPFQCIKSAALDAAVESELAKAAGQAADEADADAKGTDAAGTNQPSSLVLTGIYVRGDRGIAVIDGRLYQPGERLAAPDTAGKVWTVERVLLDRVVLRLGDEVKVLEITYPSQTSSADKGQDAAPADSDAAGEGPSNEVSGKGLKPVTSLSELLRAIEFPRNEKP